MVSEVFTSHLPSTLTNSQRTPVASPSTSISPLARGMLTLIFRRITSGMIASTALAPPLVITPEQIGVFIEALPNILDAAEAAAAEETT